MCTGEVLVPPSGDPCAAKCFGSATTLWSPLRLSPCAPRTYASPIRPVDTSHQSPPPLVPTADRAPDRAPAPEAFSTPLARASAAIASADLRAISGPTSPQVRWAQGRPSLIVSMQRLLDKNCRNPKPVMRDHPRLDLVRLLRRRIQIVDAPTPSSRKSAPAPCLAGETRARRRS